MNKTKITLAFSVLVLASLACQTLLGGSPVLEETVPDQFELPAITDIPESANENDNEGGETEGIPTLPPIPGMDDLNMGGQTDFPLPDDVANLVTVGTDIVNFQTKQSLDEMMAFYRSEFSTLGYTEREMLTVTSSTTFSMVFDGHESGKAITVQGVDLGDGTVNISISLLDL